MIAKIGICQQNRKKAQALRERKEGSLPAFSSKLTLMDTLEISALRRSE
jgi:hypothetical protein